MSKCKGDPEEEDNREAEEGGGQWWGESLWWENSLVFFDLPLFHIKSIYTIRANTFRWGQPGRKLAQPDQEQPVQVVHVHSHYWQIQQKITTFHFSGLPQASLGLERWGHKHNVIKFLVNVCCRITWTGLWGIWTNLSWQSMTTLTGWPLQGGLKKKRQKKKLPLAFWQIFKTLHSTRKHYQPIKWMFLMQDALAWRWGGRWRPRCTWRCKVNSLFLINLTVNHSF